MSPAAFIEDGLTEDQALRRVRTHCGKTAYRPNWPDGRRVFSLEQYGTLFMREDDLSDGKALDLTEEDHSAEDWIVSS